jgi:hypothetical protein
MAEIKGKFVPPTATEKKLINLCIDGANKFVRMLCGTMGFRIEVAVIRSKSTRTNAGFSIVQIPFVDETRKDDKGNGRATVCWSIQFTPSNNVDDSLWGTGGLKALGERFVMKALQGKSRGKATADVAERVLSVFNRFLSENPGFVPNLAALIQPVEKREWKKPALLNLAFQDGSISECVAKFASTDVALAHAGTIAASTASRLFLILPGEDAKRIEITGQGFEQVIEILRPLTLTAEEQAEADAVTPTAEQQEQFEAEAEAEPELLVVNG